MFDNEIDTIGLISLYRDDFSLVTRMIIKNSKIVEAESISITVPDELTDLLVSERVQKEITSTLADRFPGKEILIFSE